MDDEQQRVLKALNPGEQLLWTGRPDPRVIFTNADFILVPFSLLWTGFVVYFFIQGAAVGGGFGLVILVLFVLIGLYYVVGRFIVKAVQKTRTVYVVTNSRAIILSGERSTASVPLASETTTINRSRNGEHVSVVFGKRASRWGGSTGIYGNTGLDILTRSSNQPAFYDVEDVSALESALVRAGAPEAR